MLPALALLVPACSGNSAVSPGQVWTGTVESLPVVGKDPSLELHSVRAIRTIKVHRVAVMPLIDHPNATGEPIEEGAAESITADAWGRLTLVSGWEVVPESDVRGVMQQLPPTTLANMQSNALKLGREVSADAVLYGTVTRYEERVGTDYAAKSPAAVAFALHLIDVHNGVVLWTARYARQQEALTQNIFNVGNFLANRGRWVRAHDLAERGVDEALDDLKSKLGYTLPVSPQPMPPTMNAD
ncbi:MAG TPA: GNA1162 family protein [Candidatus Binataceae bacterium]|nr:GNA1162 family protein [Candidatus Binataceae bacterium]